MKFDEYMTAIKSGKITKTHVISLRKALNAEERRRLRLSVSSTAPKALSEEEWEALTEALATCKPQVVGELHDSGMKLLKSPRYARQLSSVKDILDGLESFHLVGFDIDEQGLATPVYRARAKSGKSFPYSCKPWRSGGNGPQIY